MTKKEINRIVKLHKRFLSGASGGVCADLSGAEPRSANMSGADLRGANLRNADMIGVNLSYADLSGADLYDVNFDNKTAFSVLQCPEEGVFIGCKRCALGRIVKLLIAEDAKRSSATTRKCRCSKAKVLEITDAYDRSQKYEDAVSQHDANFIYRVNETWKSPILTKIAGTNAHRAFTFS